MINFYIGLLIGVILGVAIMCILSLSNKDND